MQNTIEKGMKIHPLGTLVAILACMLVFYMCNFVLMRFSKKRDEIGAKEVKQRVEDVKLIGRGVIENETAEPQMVEDLKPIERDIEKTRREKARAKITIETKPLPAFVKT